MFPTTLPQLRNRIANRLMSKTLSQLITSRVECPACGEHVTPADGEFKPILDAAGAAIAWFLFHPDCIQPETDAALEYECDVFMVETSEGPVTVEIAGELSGHRPIATSRCIACGRPAEWMESDRILTTYGELWIHWDCKHESNHH